MFGVLRAELGGGQRADGVLALSVWSERSEIVTCKSGFIRPTNDLEWLVWGNIWYGRGHCALNDQRVGCEIVCVCVCVWWGVIVPSRNLRWSVWDGCYTPYRPEVVVIELI